MDISKLLFSLKQERECLDQAIAALQRVIAVNNGIKQATLTETSSEVSI